MPNIGSSVPISAILSYASRKYISAAPVRLYYLSPYYRVVSVITFVRNAFHTFPNNISM
jgi:hypothetical protein